MRLISRHFGVLCGLAVTLAATPSIAANYAIVIGINKCAKTKNIGQLGGAENDAEDFKQVLQKVYNFQEGNIRLLTGDGANYNLVEKAFDDLKQAKDFTSNDQFVFYFAGHGLRLPNSRPFAPPWEGPHDEPDHLDEALCLADALNPLTVQPAEGEYVCGRDHHLLVDDQLAKWMEKIPANRITIVLDCCHSGDGAKAVVVGGADIRERGLPGNAGVPLAGESMVRDLAPVAKGLGKTFVALYACESHEKAKERLFDKVQRGQFTKFLSDYLRRAGAGATSDTILADVKNEMHDSARKLRKQIDRDKALAQNPLLTPPGLKEPLIK